MVAIRPSRTPIFAGLAMPPGRTTCPFTSARSCSAISRLLSLRGEPGCVIVTALSAVRRTDGEEEVVVHFQAKPHSLVPESEEQIREGVGCTALGDERERIE